MYRILLLLTLMIATAMAQKESVPMVEPGPHHAGNVVPLTDGPIDNRNGEIQSRGPDGNIWMQLIEIPDATFVKVYFEDYRLLPEDTLVIMDRDGVVRQRIFGSGPAGASDFWSLSVPGDTMILQIDSPTDYSRRFAFNLSKAFKGTIDLFGLPEPVNRSDCGGLPQAEPYQSAFCYSPGQSLEDPGVWQNARGTVGVLTIGSYNSGTWCSGSLVSSQDYVLTNQHCIETISDCGNSEFVFNYYREYCAQGVGGEDPIVSQGYYCDPTNDTTYFNVPVGDCTPAGLDELDYAFCHVLLSGGDPAPSSVYPVMEMELDHSTIENTVDMYIVGHPNGYARVVSMGEMDFTTTYGLHYICETLGGSSGSPIFSGTTHRLIGLHHCGGCTTPSDRNRGMFIDQIRDDIDQHGDFFEPVPNLVYDSIAHSDVTGGNGDGYFSGGEVIDVTVELRNAGNLASTAGTLTMTSSNDDITILTGNQPIPALDASTRANTVTLNFSYQIEPTIDCGEPFDITFDAQYGDRSSAATSNLETGWWDDPGAPFDSNATDLPIAIADSSTITSNLAVDHGTDATYAVQEVEVNITHTYIGDLIVTLKSPDDRSVVLHNRTGSGTDNLNVVYGDGTGGTTAPASSLDIMQGAPVSGTWQLEVSDNAGGDEGSLDSWRLQLVPAEYICEVLLGFTMDTVSSAFGSTASMPVNLEVPAETYGFVIQFDPDKLHFTGYTPGTVAGCSSHTVQETAPGELTVTVDCSTRYPAAETLLTLDFEVMALTGDIPVTMSQLTGDLAGYTATPGTVDLPDTVDPCTIPMAYFNAHWADPAFDEPDLDIDQDQVLSVIDMAGRVNCSAPAK